MKEKELLAHQLRRQDSEEKKGLDNVRRGKRKTRDWQEWERGGGAGTQLNN
jgi:hypothetical protein